MDKIKTSRIKLLSILFVVLTISSITPWISLPIGVTTFWWIFDGIFIYELIVLKKYFFLNNNRKQISIIFLYIYWCLFCSIRGVFSANNYWDWKLLISTTAISLLPLTINFSGNPIVLPALLSNWLRYALLLFFFLFPFFLGGDPIGQFLAPISFLLLFFYELDFKWKSVSFFFLILVLYHFDARSQFIKYFAAFGLSQLFFVYKAFPQLFKILISQMRLFFLLLPLILFTLAITNVFNIFSIGENTNVDYTYAADESGGEASIKDDTRTLLYVEELESAVKNNYIIWGRTPAHGYDSDTFGADVAAALGIDRKTRDSCEVSILNIFNYYGIVGVLLYFLIFYLASGLAVNKSNNIYIQLIGVFVAFRWSFAWIEDFSNFSIEYFMLWIIIGMCFSENFRKMSNEEFKIWIKTIFKTNNTKTVKVLGLN